jgi:hypothetical protein
MAEGRHRVRPRPAPREPAGAGGNDCADQEPAEPLVPRAREPSLAPPERPPDYQLPTTTDPSAKREMVTQSWRDFLLQVCQDKNALAGLCKLMWNTAAIALVLLFAVAAVLYVTMPGSQSAKAMTLICTILAGSGMQVIRRKRRPGDLTVVGPAGPGHKEKAAQEGGCRLGGPDGDGREQGRHADPDEYAQPARNRR